MSKDLATSAVDRQNVLDNPFERHGDELLHNGYEVLRGVPLKGIEGFINFHGR